MIALMHSGFAVLTAPGRASNNLRQLAARFDGGRGPSDDKFMRRPFGVASVDFMRNQSLVPPVRLDGRGFCEGILLADFNADDGKPAFGPRKSRSPKDLPRGRCDR